MVNIGKENAIWDLFSIEKNQLRQLFDYIEASISSKNDLVCYESESFPRLLKKAVEAGGYYPIIQSTVHPRKNTFLSLLFQRIHPHLPSRKALHEQVRKHTVPCAYVFPEEQQQYCKESTSFNSDENTDMCYNAEQEERWSYIANLFRTDQQDIPAEPTMAESPDMEEYPELEF